MVKVNCDSCGGNDRCYFLCQLCYEKLKSNQKRLGGVGELKALLKHIDFLLSISKRPDVVFTANTFKGIIEERLKKLEGKGLEK